MTDTVFYLSSDPTNGISLPIKGTLTSDSYNTIGKSNLVKVEIGTMVKTIGSHAFNRCIKLTTLTIGTSVKTIGNFAFQACYVLQPVTIPDSVTSIGFAAFNGCTALKTVTIPDSVTSIGNHAFQQCIRMKSVTIGKSVTSIGGNTFYNCRELQSVTIGDSVTRIGNFAFKYCIRMKSVTIGKSVTSIGIGAFYQCGALRVLNIGDSVTSIGDNAFEFCSGLQSVTIGTSVTSIGKSVTSIGKSAFRACYELQSVTIGDSVQTIGNAAFEYCSALQLLTIGNSVTTIGSRAFGNSGLKTLYISENNGLNLKEGEQSVGGATVNVVFTPLSKANNYDGSEYYGNPNTWDVSLITDLNFLFYGKTQDNHPDISTWNVFNVNTMQGTFSNSTFNGQLNKWNVENVTDFSYCFANNVVFNQPLFRWNTQDAITLEYMFYNAWSFNQSITRTLQYNDTSKDSIGWNKKTPLEGDDWTVDKIKEYLTNIYGSATTNGTNGTSIKDPTTFRGVFGMWALFLKVPQDKDDDQKVKYPLIIKDATFIELLGSLGNSVQKLISDKKKTKLTQYNKLVSITNAMLQINKANDYIQGSNLDNDYKKYSKELYTQMRLDIPFYLAWNSLKARTMAHMKHNALTFINGNTGTVNTTLSEEIAKNPVKTLMENNYSEKTTTNIEGLGQTLDNNLKETLKTVSNNSTNLSRTAAVITTKKDSAPPVFKSDITISVGATNVYITAAEQDEKGNTTIAFASSSAALDNALTMSVSLEVDMLANMDDMTSTNQNAGVGIKGSFGTLTVGASLSTEKVTKANSAFAVESEFGALTLGQTDDQRATQATWSIASSGVNVEFMDSYTLESAKGMLESNYATGTDTGFAAGNMFQPSIGGISVGYDSASGTSVAAGIDSVINSGGETRMSVSFGGASGVVNHGRTFTDANGITGSINTDMSAATFTQGKMTIAYTTDFTEVGDDNAWPLQAAYTMGGGAFTVGFFEESSTTTEFGKTAEFKVVSFDF